MADVLTVVAKIRAAKGKGDALAALLKEQVAVVMKAEPGCLVYRPHRSTKDPDVFVKAFAAHSEKSRSHCVAVEGRSGIAAEPDEIRRVEIDESNRVVAEAHLFPDEALPAHGVKLSLEIGASGKVVLARRVELDEIASSDITEGRLREEILVPGFVKARRPGGVRASEDTRIEDDGGRESERDADAGEHGATQAHLRDAEPEDLAPQAPEPCRPHLEADDEEEHDDAELGDVEDGLGMREQPEAEGPDGETRCEVAKHRAQPQALEQGDGDDAGAEQCDDADEFGSLSGFRHGGSAGEGRRS